VASEVSAGRADVQGGQGGRALIESSIYWVKYYVHRYHIVSPGDLQDVARRLTGQVSGKVQTAAVDGRPVSS